MSILFLPNLINRILSYYFSIIHNSLLFIIYTWSIVSILKILYNYTIYFFEYVYLYIIDCLTIFKFFIKKYFNIEFINCLLNIYKNNKFFIITILTLISYIFMYIYHFSKINSKFFIRIQLYQFFILYLNIYIIYNQFLLCN